MRPKAKTAVCMRGIDQKIDARGFYHDTALAAWSAPSGRAAPKTAQQQRAARALRCVSGCKQQQRTCFSKRERAAPKHTAAAAVAAASSTTYSSSW
jgi:hypothetical protein